MPTAHTRLEIRHVAVSRDLADQVYTKTLNTLRSHYSNVTIDVQSQDDGSFFFYGNFPNAYNIEGAMILMGESTAWQVWSKLHPLAVTVTPLAMEVYVWGEPKKED